MVLRHAMENHMPANRSQVEAELAMILPTIMMFSNREKRGQLSKEAFDEMSMILKRHGAIQDEVKFEEFWIGYPNPDADNASMSQEHSPTS